MQDQRFQKYESLMSDIRGMIDNKGRGYEVAQSLNNELWEELGTHEKRMQEQVDRLKATPSEEALQQEMRSADTVYEATRSYLAKFK